MSDPHDAWEGQRIMGIDLGTTNSGVAVWDEAAGRVRMLADPEGHELMPSLVARDPVRRAWLVGREAAARRGGPEVIAHSVKRFIGRRW